MNTIESGKQKSANQVDIASSKNELKLRNKLARALWKIIWFVFARPIPRKFLNSWRIFLLRLFGAKIHKTATIYSNARILMPWNLEMDEHSIMADEVNCYNVALVKIGAHAIVSQKAFLCPGSHDIRTSTFPVILAPIIIEDQAWVAADAFIGMGVTIGQGAVVGARACVFKNVEPWTVVSGNPAKIINHRKIYD